MRGKLCLTNLILQTNLNQNNENTPKNFFSNESLSLEYEHKCSFFLNKVTSTLRPSADALIKSNLQRRKDIKGSVKNPGICPKFEYYRYNGFKSAK